MAYDGSQQIPQDDQTSEDNDSARLDSLEARVSAIEAKLGMGQQDELSSQIQQSSPYGK